MTATKPPTMRRPVPPEMLRRSKYPFDPPAALAEKAPVSRIELVNGAHAWVVSGYEQARAVLADTRFSSDVRNRSAMDLRPDEVGEARCPVDVAQREDGRFLFMDPPEHTRLRRLLTGQFTVRRMQLLEERIREISIEHLDRDARGRERGRRRARVRAAVALAGDLRAAGRGLRGPRGVPGTHRDRAQPDQERRGAGEGLGADLRLHAQAGGAQARAPGRRPRVRPDPRRRRPGADRAGTGRHRDGAARRGPRDDGEHAGAGHSRAARTPGPAGSGARGPVRAGQRSRRAAALSVDHPHRTEPRRDAGPRGRRRHDPRGRHRADLGAAGQPCGRTLAGAGKAGPQASAHAAPGVRPRGAPVPRAAAGAGRAAVGLAELVTRLPQLRLAIPADEVPLRTDMLVYGVHSLPVAWS